MSQTATGGLVRPTIGDILLSHGFVDAGTLAAAAEDQERTGQPLGQILVERGAITRLELASALAEQWAEAPGPLRPSTGLANGSPGVESATTSPAGSPVIDDDTYALRVQSAVSDLARRVGAAEPLLAEVERLVSESVSPGALEAGLAEVQSHVDASLERMAGLESGLESVSTRLDQVTDSLEEAFGEMQVGAAELVERLEMTAAAVTAAATEGDLEALRQTLDARLTELATSIGAESRQLDEAWATLAALAERPEAAPEIVDRVDELAVRLDSLGRGEDLAHLREAVQRLEERLAAAADPAALDAVRRNVDELVGRPDVPPALERRLDEIDARLSETAMGDIARLAGVEASVTDLAARVESLGAVAASGASSDAIEELRSALEELGRRRQGDEETVARLDELAATVDELAARPGADPALADRIEGLAQALAGIAADAAAADLRTAFQELADRGGVGELALAELAGRVERLSSEVAAARADERVVDLSESIEEIRRRLETDDASLADLRAAATELGARPAGDPELAGRLAALATRVDELAAATADTADLARDGSSLEELGIAVTSAHNELAVGLGEVAARVAALEDTAPPEPVVAGDPADLVALREELAAGLREGLAGLIAEAPAGDVAWADEAARLEERLDALSAIVGDGGSADPKNGAPSAALPLESENDTEQELERLRMAIERMSMHLGEQERALVEVMGSRGVAQRLDELEARIDDVLDGAAAGGAVVATTGEAASPGSSKDARALARRLDAAEAALEAEREKLFTKLERMGSSIDWRLQRLEAGGVEVE